MKMRTLLLAGIAALFLATGTAHAAKLTPKQRHDFDQFRSIGISKKEAKQAARDPGVKKNEWGWTCENPETGELRRVKGSGARYKRNAVCE
jgi:hypothetical protein